MANLGWRRIAAGHYASKDGAYRVARAVEGQRGEWRVTVTADPCGEPIKRATLAEAKAAAESHADPDPSGPSVRLTPAPADTKREATDAEVLQLCAMLDAGVRVTRSLYQEYTVTGTGGWTLNLDAVNRAARDAVRFGLARQAFVDRHYVLTAEPIHLDTGTGMTGCGVAQSYSTIRRRWTTDPAKVTHERCRTT